MSCRLELLFVSSFLVLAACNYPKIEDHGDVCVYASEEDGQNRLQVRAQGYGCTSDHKGAYLKCTITVDGQHAHIETVFKDGKDPNDACAPPVEGTCEVVVEPGDYTLEFDGEQQMIAVPGGDHVCFGIPFDTDTE